MVVEPVRIGTAGWALPRELQVRFPGAGTHLERYAACFNAVEVNSTFHRPHRASTFARWADSVGPGFRFSVKLSRTITHDSRLSGTRALVEAFLASIAPLGSRLGCLLVQLPPSLELDRRIARPFLAALRDRFEPPIALEPRHASWFSPEGEDLLAGFRIARVAADPARSEKGGEPGGWTGLEYYRLHGSPRVYYSSYGPGYLDALAAKLRTPQPEGTARWCIFDNTTLGAGTANAVDLAARLRAP